MSIKLKSLLLIICAWSSLILLSYLSYYLFNVPNFFAAIAGDKTTSLIIWSLLFPLCSLGLFYLFFIKRIEALNKRVATEIQKAEYTHPIKVVGNDEISDITSQINTLTSSILVTDENIELRIRARTKKLMERVEEMQSRLETREQEKKQLMAHNKTLTQIAHYDSLTGLPTRILFNESFDQSLINSRENNKVLALLIISLDNFKFINDNLGRPFGNLVLIEMASRLKGMIRSDDLLGRSGGAEFSILLNDIVHTEFPNLVCEKIIDLCSVPLSIENKNVKLIVNIGIAVFPEDGSSLEELFKAADVAMFKAKKKQESHYCRYNKDMNDTTNSDKLTKIINSAIVNKEFSLYYQPRLNLKDGTVVGIEALMRWESSMGLISPSRFIPMAEETGSIMQLGEWALREACMVNKSWQDQSLPAIPIAVNISTYQLLYQDIPTVVNKVLNDTKLNPKYLDLEISSDILVKHYNVAVEILKKLNNLGVNIIIDDFGRSPLSIGMLKELPIQVLKIDQQYIRNIPENKNDLDIINTIISLARNLKIKAVATGIETKEQLQYLADQDCEIGQGYFFSKPLSKNNFLTNYFYMDGLRS